MEYTEALSCALSGEAIFLIGAGFSIGATNVLGLPFFAGSKLAEDLCNKVNLEPDTPLDIISQEYIDTIGERSLVKYLKEHFSVEEYAPYYKAFARIKELKVYSVNYDNLLEQVCNDCGKKVESYDLSAKINKVDKRNMIMHLNGGIENLGDTLDENFNLTHLSYSKHALYNSPWYPYLNDELRSSRAIFIIGLSFKSDLDLRRLISLDSEIIQKCFIIESPHISEKDASFLSKYGRVLQNGVKEFCNDLLSAPVIPSEKSLTNYKFKSFVEIKRNKAYEKPEDKEIFDMFFLGNTTSKNLFFSDATGNFSEIVNRTALEFAAQQIAEGMSMVVHSDLGNGKTMLISQLIYKLPSIRFFTIQARQNDKFLNEIEILCSDSAKKVIIIDPYNLYLSDFEKFKSFDLSNVQFILAARTPMHENCSGILYDIIDQMQNVSFQTYDLNNLDDKELDELSSIISKYGFWGEQSSLSSVGKIDILQRQLKGRFQNILLYLFKECEIKKRFEDILQSVCSDKTVLKILILSFINEILELNFGPDDFNIIFERDNIDRIIRRHKDDLGELIDYHSDSIQVKSSIIAKSLIVSEIIQKNDILETLVQVAKRLDLLYAGNRKYTNALKNLASASYLSFIFDYEIDHNILISYYERIKESSFNKDNLFFWEQYAITCVNLKDYPRADKYFKTSYSLARRKGLGFSTFQIDNHYARYLLENQIYIRNFEKALNPFVQAHQLLLKRSNIDDSINDRYYQFRVATLYKEYYDVFYEHFNDQEKKVFLDRCREMKSKLSAYIKNNSGIEFKRYIYDCQRNLEYILKGK